MNGWLDDVFIGAWTKVTSRLQQALKSKTSDDGRVRGNSMFNNSQSRNCVGKEHHIELRYRCRLNMPRMSGFEFLSVVRRCVPEILTVAMSGACQGREFPAGVIADAFYPKRRECQQPLYDSRKVVFYISDA